MLLPNVSTSILIMELRNRVFDQIEDPEPQYDACLSELSGKRLLELGVVLQDTPITTPEPKEV